MTQQTEHPQQCATECTPDSVLEEPPAHATDDDQAVAPTHLGGMSLLLFGLLLGLLLGPMVLGQISAERYAVLFPNPVSAQFKLDEIQNTRRTLAMTDVSPVALREYDQQRQSEIDTHKQAIERAEKNRSLMDALLLASLCGLLVINMTAIDSRLHHRLLLGSHLLLASWLSLFLAQPYLLARIPSLVILGSILMIATFIGLPPYQSKHKAMETGNA